MAILVAIYSAARVSRPIVALTHTRQQNEIGMLAAGFNTITSTLQQALAGQSNA